MLMPLQKCISVRYIPSEVLEPGSTERGCLLLAGSRGRKSSTSNVEESSSPKEHPRILRRDRVNRESKQQKHIVEQIDHP